MKYNKEYSFIDTTICDFEKYISNVAIILEKQKIGWNKIENIEFHVNLLFNLKIIYE